MAQRERRAKLLRTDDGGDSDDDALSYEREGGGDGDVSGEDGNGDNDCNSDDGDCDGVRGGGGDDDGDSGDSDCGVRGSYGDDGRARMLRMLLEMKITVCL